MVVIEEELEKEEIPTQNCGQNDWPTYPQDEGLSCPHGKKYETVLPKFV